MQHVSSDTYSISAVSHFNIAFSIPADRVINLCEVKFSSGLYAIKKIRGNDQG